MSPHMDRILWEASFSGDGIAHFLDDRNRRRRERLAALFARLDGHLEAMYFSFEDATLYVIASVPAGVPVRVVEPELARLLTDAIQMKSVVLVSPEELDRTVVCPPENALFPPGSGSQRLRHVPSQVLELARRRLERRIRAAAGNDTGSVIDPPAADAEAPTRTGRRIRRPRLRLIVGQATLCGSAEDETGRDPSLNR